MNLVLVELRKTVDTRTARWVLGIVALLVVAAPVARHGARTFPALADAAQLPVSILLPVLAVLAVTGEWSQRTGLTTFVLVPARWRVVLAKLAAVALLAAAASLLALAVAAVLARGGFSAAVAGQQVLVGLATMLCGFGFGLLLLGSPAAVAAYYVMPIAFAAAGRLVPALDPAAGWLDLSRTRGPLAEAGVSAAQWARFGVSVALWVALPVAAGLVRTARADVR